MKLWSKFSIIFSICLFASGCEPSSSSSGLESVPQDGKMKVFRVPLPVNFFDFGENKFPDEVPLITSSKGGTAEQYGYWILCSDPAEQKALIEGLGLDYSKYESAHSSLRSADQYQPNPAKRDEEKKKYCSSSVLFDKVLCSLYSLAPEKQSPIICPSSLELIDGGYDLSIYSTGTKFYAEYQNGLAAMTAMDLGCPELKNALMPKSPGFAITPIEESQAPVGATDLNCARSAPQESFVSICTDARAGKAKEEFFTLNALSSRLGIPLETECDDLKTKINDKISTLKDEPLDLSKAVITSLKLLRYLPAVANVKTLLLNDNENLGANDTAANGVMDELKTFINLKKINVQGTKISNMLGLKDLQFLGADLRANWPQIFPEACSTNSISEPLRKFCSDLQQPISIQREGAAGRTLVVGKIEETKVKFIGSHPYDRFLDTQGFAFSAQSTCGDFIQEGSSFQLKQLPIKTCQLTVEAKGGRLVPGVFTLIFQPLEQCEGHPVDSIWTEKTDTYELTHSCQRFGDAVRKITSGACFSKDYRFDLLRNACVVKMCPDGQAVGTEWDAKTEDKIGSFKNSCVVDDVEPVVKFVKGTGSCTDNQYDFTEASLTCELKRCADGSPIGTDKIVVIGSGRGSYTDRCTLVDNRTVYVHVPGTGVCKSSLDDFNSTNMSCQAARCENGFVIGQSDIKYTAERLGYYTEECLVSENGTSRIQTTGQCNFNEDTFDSKSLSCHPVCQAKPELPSDYYRDDSLQPSSVKSGTLLGPVTLKYADGSDATITIKPDSTLLVFTDRTLLYINEDTPYFPVNTDYNRSQLEGKVKTSYYSAAYVVYRSSKSVSAHRREIREAYAAMDCGSVIYERGGLMFLRSAANKELYAYSLDGNDERQYFAKYARRYVDVSCNNPFEMNEDIKAICGR